MEDARAWGTFLTGRRLKWNGIIDAGADDGRRMEDAMGSGRVLCIGFVMHVRWLVQ